MRRAVKIASIGMAVALVAGAAITFSLYRASQQVPEFYQAAVTEDATGQEEPRDEFVAQATALASDLRRAGRWQRVFSSQQINSWLALDLAASYPELTKGALRDPRIEIGDRGVTLACRYDNGTVSTVMSLAIDAYIHEPNVLALRIRRARAGALPVPLTQVLDAISQAARELKLRLEWRKTHGDPLALISLANDQASSRFEVQTVELRQGELLVTGKVNPRHEPPSPGPPTVPLPTARNEDVGSDDDQPRVGSASKETRQE